MSEPNQYDYSKYNRGAVEAEPEHDYAEVMRRVSDKSTWFKVAEQLGDVVAEQLNEGTDFYRKSVLDDEEREV